MTDISTSTTQPGARLFRLLNDLGVLNEGSSEPNIAQHLSDMIDFNGSIRLSETRVALPRVVARAQRNKGEDVRHQFLRVRASMLQFIARSFGQRAPAQRIVLPEPNLDKFDSAASAFLPYGKFYIAMQRELAQRSQGLREAMRDNLRAHSDRLARLVALDKALDESLAAHYREMFGAIPKLLALRLEDIIDDLRPSADAPASLHQRWERPGGGHDRFCYDMRAVSLAALELRLEPHVGLLEALDEEVGDTP